MSVHCLTCRAVQPVLWRHWDSTRSAGLDLLVFATDVQLALHDHGRDAGHVRTPEGELAVTVPCPDCGEALRVPSASLTDGNRVNVTVSGQDIAHATLRHLTGPAGCARR